MTYTLGMAGRTLTALTGLGLCVAAWASPAGAQENFEIQVYGSETVAPGSTMVELHSNVAAEGSRRTENGVLRTQGAFHETLEITQGIASWFETGLYVFTSIQPDTSWEWVGTHIRPRVRAPESWELPVGLSLSAELGYQRRAFSTDAWTLELRPIIDRQWSRWYVAINPTLERAIKGESVDRGFEFLSRRQNQLQRDAHRRDRTRILRLARPGDPLRPAAGPAAPALSGDRPGSGPPVGVQRRDRLRTDSEHRPPHRQDDPRLSLQLGGRRGQITPAGLVERLDGVVESLARERDPEPQVRTVAPPTGTVTFLFHRHREGSTRLWQSHYTTEPASRAARPAEAARPSSSAHVGMARERRGERARRRECVPAPRSAGEVPWVPSTSRSAERSRTRPSIAVSGVSIVT